ncbi:MULTISPECIES: hypothetical protein [Pseudomonadota]|uniref:hypothetical protein n=1 Tax=Pseudomonadota TaxID=1224 RepID=UPI00262134BC|nr:MULTISPECIES: hypothetical protein [Pseudomonadota]
MKSDLIDIEVIYQTRTERAVCVREIEDGEDVWLPLSQVEVDGPFRRGGTVTLTGPERLLTEKGLL